MNTQRAIKYVILFLVVVTIMSCDTYHAKKLSGTYSCVVSYHYMDITPSNIDTSYFEDIEIKREGNDLIVLGYKIRVDNLWGEEEYYEGTVHNNITVQFMDDNIKIYRYSGGLGGSSSYSYLGTKK